MHRITESIEIYRPPESVFALLRDIEARIRLNPACSVISFEPLNHKEMCAGARFRFFLMINGKRSKYECEVVELVENRKIVSRALDDRLRITLTLAETPRGTMLTHDERFHLSDDIIYQAADAAPALFLPKLWRKLRQMLLGFDLLDDERARREREILEMLRNVLRTWLARIKETVESDRAP